MKVIIDIPEYIYNVLMETGKYGFYRFDAKKAIKNGAPFDNVLDKIGAEIEDIYCGQYCKNPLTADMVKERILEIIDKYKEN